MEPVTNSLSKIIESGILGAGIVLLIVALVYVYRELRESEKSRINDSKEVQNTIVAPMEKISQRQEKEAEERKREYENILDALDSGTKRRR